MSDKDKEIERYLAGVNARTTQAIIKLLSKHIDYNEAGVITKKDMIELLTKFEKAYNDFCGVKK